MWNSTVTQKLGIQFPIIQGPFGGRFSSVKLASTISNLGGLGSFGLNAYGPEEILEVDRKMRSSTNKPYVLNLWVPLKNDPANHYGQEDFEALKPLFEKDFARLNVPLPEAPPTAAPRFEAQAEALIEAAPPIASFIFGIPEPEITLALKANGTTVMATATTVDEALAIEAAGIELVILSGMQAGGHRGAFINSPDVALNSTHELLAAAKGQLKIPVIAAGGITTGADIAQALHFGAGAAQLGTVFLATAASNAPDEHKEKLFAPAYETELTKVFTGRLARVIRTPFSGAISAEEEHIIAPFPIQSTFLAHLRKAAKAMGIADYEAWWAGQPTTTLKHRSAEALFNALKLELEQAL